MRPSNKKLAFICSVLVVAIAITQHFSDQIRLLIGQPQADNSVVDCGAILPGLSNGVQYAASGDTRVAYMYVATTGELRTTKHDGIEIYQARVYSKSASGDLHDTLWVSTGMLLDGDYVPMTMAQDSWESEDAAAEVFGDLCRQFRVELTGFVRSDNHIAWENCPAWKAFTPDGVCDLGLELELAGRGASVSFMLTGDIPDDFFLFGWPIVFQ